MKVCTGCKIKKEFVDFGRRASAPDGHNPRCLICMREDGKRYYRNSDVPAKVKRNREYRDQNRERVRAYDRDYYARNPEKKKANARAYTKANPDKIRDISFRKLYGITINEYNDKLASQNGVCEICKTMPGGKRTKFLFVDHNHTTKAVRGLLCHSCNNGLGMFKDSKVLTQAATDYLSKYEQ